MPDPSPTLQPHDQPHARRRDAAPGRASEAELLALVDRAARIPDGLALLERGHLECVAVLLGHDPRAVERARAALEEPSLREAAAREFARLSDLRRAVKAAASRPRPPPPRDPEALILAARRRADGLSLLLAAAPEAAAVAFGVHPDLVHGARELAALGRPGGDVPPAL